MGGVERPRGQTLKGSLCPLEELGRYLSAVGVSENFQAGGPDVDISQAPGLKPAHSRDSINISGMNVGYMPGLGWVLTYTHLFNIHSSPGN